MKYSLEITPSCLAEIKKASKKNKKLEFILKKKMKQILDNPGHYKPLKYSLFGERRTHIMKSFILKFQIKNNKVIFISFTHHDNAYNFIL
ncbi:MAG: type II toxin-antitoxin system RelE/ParE family toxin [Nanoarchaeota archaeon]|nr:type II toxin-antitoxin system RelE/ParE family toxin [Nanoarchaeota archaeon]